MCNLEAVVQLLVRSLAQCLKKGIHVLLVTALHVQAFIEIPDAHAAHSALNVRSRLLPSSALFDLSHVEVIGQELTSRLVPHEGKEP
eukprot:CAMPEP_0185157234 /NCGR_PEP_ID=MMETSP1139-20130426/1640_1 /TAXON_ID=298111 /ORGANISM="Pavlova sp., Strain CCMP459" /LENGTH=86 /DNA_ID=CAMNT_0027722305 /DNA_START=626 /DNA_END=886 /DNA_ORIENTATION=-